jgi:hypothetical protein
MSEELWIVDPGRGMGVLELGSERDEVLRRLADAGIEIDPNDEEPAWIFVGDMDTELTFTTEPTPRLREIVVEDERIRFGPLPVLGKRVHEIVDFLRVPAGETLWRLEADDDQPVAPEGSGAMILSDEVLLDRGTLWLTTLGIGLGIVRGEVTTIRLRKPEGSPRRGNGPLTDAQRALSQRSDLPTYLVRLPGGTARRGSWIQSLATLALFAALGWLVWHAIQYQQRWNTAPVAEGEVIEVRPPPPDPFPSEFTIAYRDDAGLPHQVVLKRADVYVTQSVGEKVELRYLPEAPDQPLGPAAYRDAAFQKFVPWGIGIMAAYCVLQLVVSIALWTVGRAGG